MSVFLILLLAPKIVRDGGRGKAVRYGKKKPAGFASRRAIKRRKDNEAYLVTYLAT